MRKFFILCIMAFVMCSCNKHNAVENPMVTISFNQQMVTGLPMTKGTTNDFLNIIAEQTPTYVNVTLKNLDLGKTFTCKSNESITIPIGNYEISANSATPEYEYVVGTSGSIYKTPIIKCSTNTHSITTITSSITLYCYYDCYAVFALVDECQSCCATYIDKNVSFYKKGKYYVGYFQYDGMKVNLTPYDDSNDFISTSYTFSTTYDVNKVYAEYGKYYVIHPQQVDKVTSSFTMQLPTMVEGEI